VIPSQQLEAEARARAVAVVQEQQRNAAQASRTEDLKKAGPVKRLREAKSFAATCVTSGACDADTAASLVASAAEQKDGELIGSIVGATMAVLAPKQAKDGPVLSVGPISKAAEPLLANGKIGLRHLPTCSRGEAMNDPVAQRGKVILASGQVAQIHRDGPVFVGTLVSEALKATHFVTPFDTGKIVEGTYGTFRGMFAQEYDYPNVSGGETQAVALVGAFD
jgi:hypothetical protein